jgi:tetraacyldisaccharide 4'-kinase
MFDSRILKSVEFDIPVISVGNITTGGTGKTPHVEYLLDLLSEQYTTAVLSRGYKRKSKGFILASNNSTAAEIGDESLQIKQKYPGVMVAVDADRLNGIRELLKITPPVQLIILDDAYQHRWVKPGFNILLIDFNRRLKKDWLLPVGRLREPAWEKRRANLIVLSKCPDDLKPIDRRILMSEINPADLQTLCFSSLGYGSLQPVFKGLSAALTLDQFKSMRIPVLLVTGIANPEPLKQFLSDYCSEFKHILFPDHHAFSPRDLLHIMDEFDSITDTNKILVMTEKDAVRLQVFIELDEEIREKMYYIPIKIKFSESDEMEFNQHILSYVSDFKRNRSVSAFAHQPAT